MVCVWVLASAQHRRDLLCGCLFVAAVSVCLGTTEGVMHVLLGGSICAVGEDAHGIQMCISRQSLGGVTV